MTLNCECNRLREAESALFLACNELEVATESCPADMFGWDLPRCVNDCKDDYAECWREAFIRKARREQ